jgi:hypothetical protein
VFVVADALRVSKAAQIAKLSFKYQLPSMHQVRAEAEAGGLMSYGPDITDLYRRAATYVDAILKGCKACGPARPAADVRTLPVIVGFAVGCGLGVACEAACAIALAAPVDAQP